MLWGLPSPRRSPLGLPVLSFASLQSWSSLLRTFYSVSALLVRSHSLSVLLSTVRLCGCLLPFLPLLVSSASPCRCFGRGPHSLLFGVAFFVFLPFFCSVHPFALCLCVVAICFLILGWTCILFLALESLFVALCRCHWCILPCSLCVGYWFLQSFCLVRVSSSLHDEVSLWDESGFDFSSLSLGSLFSLPVLAPFGSSLRSVLLGLIRICGSLSDVVTLWDESRFCWFICLACVSGFPFRGGLPLGSCLSFFYPLPPSPVVAFPAFRPLGLPLTFLGSLSRSGFHFHFLWDTPFHPRSFRLALPSLQSLFPWCLSAVGGLGLRSEFPLVWFCVPALLLILSVRAALFLASVFFFIAATPSCLLVLLGMGP